MNVCRWGKNSLRTKVFRNGHVVLQVCFFLNCLTGNIAFTQNNALSIDNLLDSAWINRDSDQHTALALLNLVIQKAATGGTNVQLGKAYNIIGLIHRNSAEYDLAEEYFLKAKKIRLESGDSIGVANVLNNLGTLEKIRGNYEQSLNHLFEAAGIYERNDQDLPLANTYINIANTFQKDNDLPNAIKYHQKSHDLFLIHGDSLQIADAKYSLAADFLLANQLDSSAIYAEESLEYFYKLGFWDGEADAQDILAQIAREQKDFSEAQELYQSAIQLYENYGEPNDARLFLLYLNRGGLFIEMKKGKEALADLRRAKFLLADRNEPDNRLRLARGFTDAFALTGQLDSALLMNKEAFRWLDTLEVKGRAEAIAEMKEKYETEQKEKIIVEQKLQKQEAIVQRNTILSLLLIVLGATIFGFIYFHQQQKSAATIARQQRQLHQKEIEDLLKTQELTAINSMLEGQENERLRIAKDLHDRLGSMLTTIKWSFDGYLEKQATTAEIVPLEKTSDLLDDACQEVRRIAHNMTSGVLTKFGLIPALQELARTVSASGKMQVKIINSGLGNRLDSKVEITLYRIIQELLSNILKHAQATETIIQLTRLNDELNISVEDNGKGFDPEKVTHGMGIKNMEARVQALDGSLFFDSGKGNGTTVMIDLPV